MIFLAVPLCCYELEAVQETAFAGTSSGTEQADRDECPCCPDEDKTGSESCATCSNCSYYVPLTPALSTNYAPALSRLTPGERFSQLPDVHLPIFVPPQNLV